MNTLNSTEPPFPMMTLTRRGTAAAAALIGLLTAACAPEYSSDTAAKAQDETAAMADPVMPQGVPGEPVPLDQIRKMLAHAIPELGANAVRPAPAPGMYEVQSGSLYGYITQDGRYLIEGDLIDLQTGQSLTENARKTDRLAKLAALGEDKMIVFTPEGGAAANRKVTVFTDVDCGYCRKLHREMDQYLAKGIEIRYAFYPRSGPDTDSFRKAEAVWCSADRKEAMTVAKQTGKADGPVDCENPVREEWELGAELGLRGTPMMILPNGEVVNGYVPAGPLADRLAALDQAG
ncbi:DsbC family protein [Sinimarinibacterium sp. CAU 1509]|uniref:DsbC family protein n=1 Tax=Sinimarinibacterium sp. CAU 1509 TaxID=2562283 RepID=UPI0010AC44A1|nr:DsbC family protein [Sinimarinibacterium sp. CAU 1509]TJY62930.1 DsbC family protein [Sinimarinibacterium sp. CAU 1509]